MELAMPICVDYIGGKTDILKPAKGHLVIKTIQKCQTVYRLVSIWPMIETEFS